MSFNYVPVTSAPNLSGGAAGEVPYQTATGATAFTTVGTTGQVLTSQGSAAPIWAAVAGGVSLISTKTASGGASLTWTGLSGYVSYMMILSNLLPSSGDNFGLQIGTGAGPTYITSGYVSATIENYGAGITQTDAGTVSKAYATICSENGGNLPNFYGLSGFIYLQNFNGGYFSMQSTTNFSGTATNSTQCLSTTQQKNTNTVTAIKIYCPFFGSTIASGTVSLYGITS